MTYREKTPTMLSILTRKLKPGKSFEDFKRAHVPVGDSKKTEFGYDIDFFRVFLRFLVILLGFWDAPGPQKSKESKKK